MDTNRTSPTAQHGNNSILSHTTQIETLGPFCRSRTLTARSLGVCWCFCNIVLQPVSNCHIIYTMLRVWRKALPIWTFLNTETFLFWRFWYSGLWKKTESPHDSLCEWVSGASSVIHHRIMQTLFIFGFTLLFFSLLSLHIYFPDHIYAKWNGKCGLSSQMTDDSKRQA